MFSQIHGLDKQPLHAVHHLVRISQSKAGMKHCEISIHIIIALSKERCTIVNLVQGYACRKQAISMMRSDTKQDMPCMAAFTVVSAEDLLHIIIFYLHSPDVYRALLSRHSVT